VSVGLLIPGRAPDSKRPLDLGHQWNMSFVSPTHETKLPLCVLPPTMSGVRVRKGCFVPSSDTIGVASLKRVPESGPPCLRGGGGDTGGTSTARREERHCSLVV